MIVCGLFGNNRLQLKVVFAVSPVCHVDANLFKENVLRNIDYKNSALWAEFRSLEGGRAKVYIYTIYIYIYTHTHTYIYINNI